VFIAPVQTTIAPVNPSLPPEDLPLAATLDQIPEYLRGPVDALIDVLTDSVRRRVENIPPLL
jgi:hypothetical protein